MLPPLADLPPVLQERVVCSITAALRYQIPANLVLAVAEKEGGKPGQWVRNPNGTHDVGAMQFNTTYLDALRRYGITADDVAAAGCYAFDLAAWRLRGHILHDQGDLWTRAANYHSRTPKYNKRYRADLMVKAAKWATWLEARFATVELTRKNGKTARPDSTSKTIRKAARKADTAEHRSRPPSGARRSGPVDYVPRTVTFDEPKTQP